MADLYEYSTPELVRLLGTRFKDYRMRCNLTQREVAEQSGIGLTTIHKFENGTALCAIEAAYRQGKIDFPKPVSCHLYPIRVKDYGEFTAVNYHEWDICKDALKNSNAEPLYKLLKEPLIRRFSKEWYECLVNEIESENSL